VQQPNSRFQAWHYVAFTYIITWICWGVAVLGGKGIASPLTRALIGLGGLGPAIAGVGLAWRSGNEFWRDYWQRLTQPRRISPAWWGVILLLAPTLAALAAGVDHLLGGAGLALEIETTGKVAWPLAVAGTALFTFFFGPLPEELGWRGYALDRLLSRHDPLIASLILGGLWAFWHAPLFLIAGSYQARLAASAFGVERFAAAILAQTALMTLIHVHTQRSTLAAVLFHYIINLTGELLTLSPQGELYYTALWLLAALAVIVGGGRRGFHPRTT